MLHFILFFIIFNDNFFIYLFIYLYTRFVNDKYYIGFRYRVLYSRITSKIKFFTFNRLLVKYYISY